MKVANHAGRAPLVLGSSVADVHEASGAASAPTR
jgi:hypothetical protein